LTIKKKRSETMALEDRCTPQSAPSPPSGSPHSPQNASSYHEYHTNNNTAILFEHQQHSTRFTTENQMPLYEPSIKLENENTQDTIPTVRFSITNILSDKFGKTSYKSRLRANRHEKAEVLFRPYDLNSNDGSEKFSETTEYQEIENNRTIYNESLAESIRLANLFEYRQKCINLANSGLFHSFSATSYPRIHAEISNSSRQQHQNKYVQPPKYVEPTPVKQHSGQLGSLSSLSKTVSQIGSEKPVAQRWSEPSSSPSVSPASSVQSPPIQQIRLPFLPTKGHQHQKDGCESSDDTRSETSSTKNDGDPVFPAWIYCTRYSDRPSSGEKKNILKLFEQK
jgi:homeobox protein engrailed